MVAPGASTVVLTKVAFVNAKVTVSASNAVAAKARLIEVRAPDTYGELLAMFNGSRDALAVALAAPFRSNPTDAELCAYLAALLVLQLPGSHDFVPTKFVLSKANGEMVTLRAAVWCRSFDRALAGMLHRKAHPNSWSFQDLYDAARQATTNAKQRKLLGLGANKTTMAELVHKACLLVVQLTGQGDDAMAYVRGVFLLTGTAEPFVDPRSLNPRSPVECTIAQLVVATAQNLRSRLNKVRAKPVGKPRDLRRKHVRNAAHPPHARGWRPRIGFATRTLYRPGSLAPDQAQAYANFGRNPAERKRRRLRAQKQRKRQRKGQKKLELPKPAVEPVVKRAKAQSAPKHWEAPPLTSFGELFGKGTALATYMHRELHARPAVVRRVLFSLVPHFAALGLPIHAAQLWATVVRRFESLLGDGRMLDVFAGRGGLGRRARGDAVAVAQGHIDFSVAGMGKAKGGDGDDDDEYEASGLDMRRPAWGCCKHVRRRQCCRGRALARGPRALRGVRGGATNMHDARCSCSLGK